jgi:hypothetical protein
MLGIYYRRSEDSTPSASKSWKILCVQACSRTCHVQCETLVFVYPSGLVVTCRYVIGIDATFPIVRAKRTPVIPRTDREIRQQYPIFFTAPGGPKRRSISVGALSAACSSRFRRENDLLRVPVQPRLRGKRILDEMYCTYDRTSVVFLKGIWVLLNPSDII